MHSREGLERFFRKRGFNARVFNGVEQDGTRRFIVHTDRPWDATAIMDNVADDISLIFIGQKPSLIKRLQGILPKLRRR